MPENQPISPTLVPTKKPGLIKSPFQFGVLLIILIIIAGALTLTFVSQKTNLFKPKAKANPENSQVTQGVALGVWGKITKIQKGNSPDQVAVSLLGNDQVNYLLNLDDTVTLNHYSAATENSPPIFRDQNLKLADLKVGDTLYITTKVDLHQVKTLNPADFNSIEVHTAD